MLKLNQQFNVSGSRSFYSVGSIILCILIFLINFYHYSSYTNIKYPINHPNISFFQDFDIYEIEKNGFSNSFEINIIFDTSHHSVWSIWDTGFMGYSDLAIFLMDNSFRVSASTRFLNETIPALNNDDILVLNVGKNQTYTDQEINLIDQFVYQGGGLLVFGEHNNTYGTSTFQNKLLGKFNMSINDDLVEDNTSHYQLYDPWIVINSSFFNITNITLFAAASMTLNAGAFSIANASSNSNPIEAIVGAGCEYGNGKVICVTDSEFIWNGNDGTGGNFKFGIKLGNNSKFALEIFKYLANKSFNMNSIKIKPQYNLFTANSFLLNLTTNGIYNITTDIQGGIITPEQLINAGTWSMWNITVNNDGYVNFLVNNSTQIKNCTVYFFKPTNPIKTILISEVNFSRRAEPTLSGLYNFSYYLRNHNFSVFASEFELNASNFDAVCVANPLRNFSDSQISNLLTSKRLLVLGESYTTLATHNPVNKIYRSLGFNPIWNPINLLLLNFDINLTNFLICDNISNHKNNPIYPKVYSNFSKLEFFAYQSSVVNTSSPNLEIFVSGKSTSWGEGNSSLGHNTPLSFSKGDIIPTPLIVYNSSIMAIGDTDIISNERGEAFIFPFLECWLKLGEPYKKIQLTPSKGKIFADGKSQTTITSGIIYDSNGNELNNGIQFTLITDLGKIISSDEDKLTPGIQISIKNRILTFRIRAGLVNGIANISAYNFSLAIIGQIQVKFLYSPIRELVTIFIKNQLDLKNTHNFILTLMIYSISIGAISSILIIERKGIQTKIVSLKKTIKQKNIERKRKKVKIKKKKIIDRKKKKFERKKL